MDKKLTERLKYNVRFIRKEVMRWQNVIFKRYDITGNWSLTWKTASPCLYGSWTTKAEPTQKLFLIYEAPYTKVPDSYIHQ